MLQQINGLVHYNSMNMRLYLKSYVIVILTPVHDHSFSFSQLFLSFVPPKQSDILSNIKKPNQKILLETFQCLFCVYYLIMENLKFFKYDHTRYHIPNVMIIQTYNGKSAYHKFSDDSELKLQKCSKLLKKLCRCWGKGQRRKIG